MSKLTNEEKMNFLDFLFTEEANEIIKNNKSIGKCSKLLIEKYEKPLSISFCTKLLKNKPYKTIDLNGSINYLFENNETLESILKTKQTESIKKTDDNVMEKNVKTNKTKKQQIKC